MNIQAMFLPESANHIVTARPHGSDRAFSDVFLSDPANPDFLSLMSPAVAPGFPTTAAMPQRPEFLESEDAQTKSTPVPGGQVSEEGANRFIHPQATSIDLLRSNFFLDPHSEKTIANIDHAMKQINGFSDETLSSLEPNSPQGINPAADSKIGVTPARHQWIQDGSESQTVSLKRATIDSSGTAPQPQLVPVVSESRPDQNAGTWAGGIKATQLQVTDAGVSQTSEALTEEDFPTGHAFVEAAFPGAFDSRPQASHANTRSSDAPTVTTPPTLADRNFSFQTNSRPTDPVSSGPQHSQSQLTDTTSTPGAAPHPSAASTSARPEVTVQPAVAQAQAGNTPPPHPPTTRDGRIEKQDNPPVRQNLDPISQHRVVAA